MVIQSLAKFFVYLFFLFFNCVPFWSALILSILFKCGNEMMIIFSVQLNRLLRSYVCCHHCSHPPLPLQRGYEMRVRLWCMSLRWAVQNVVFLDNSTEKKWQTVLMSDKVFHIHILYVLSLQRHLKHMFLEWGFSQVRSLWSININMDALRGSRLSPQW